MLKAFVGRDFWLFVSKLKSWRTKAGKSRTNYIFWCSQPVERERKWRRAWRASALVFHFTSNFVGLEIAIVMQFLRTDLSGSNLVRMLWRHYASLLQSWRRCRTMTFADREWTTSPLMSVRFVHIRIIWGCGRLVWAAAEARCCVGPVCCLIDY